jgi:hypothetical protein
MKKKTKSNFLMLAVAFSLISCVLMGVFTLVGRGGPREGIVVEKRYSPAHVETKNNPMIIGKLIMYQEEKVHHPDRWFVTIKNGEHSREHQVTRSDYQCLNIGDTWKAKE